MYGSVAGTSSRLLCRHGLVRQPASRPPPNLSLFTRARSESTKSAPPIYRVFGAPKEPERVLPWQNPTEQVLPEESEQRQDEGNDPAAANEVQAQKTAPSYWSYRTPPRPRTRRLDLNVNTVELGKEVLGEPATIRIIQEHPKQPVFRHTEELVLSPAIDAQELEDLALAQPDAGPQEVDAIMAKFKEEFMAKRQLDGSFLHKDCIEISECMQNGLTFSQLEKYYRRQPAQLQTTDVDDLERFYSSEDVIRARWFSRPSPFPNTARLRLMRKYWKQLLDEQDSIEHWKQLLDERDSIVTLRRTKRKRLARKERLTENILRKLWGVREKREMQFGELDMRVKNADHLMVLLRNYADVFQRRAKQLNVQFEISKLHSCIRISGEYGLTGDAFRLILQDIQRVATEAVEMNFLGAGVKTPLNDADARTLSLPPHDIVRQIENVTRTKVQTHEKHPSEPNGLRTIHISYLGPDKTDFHDAYRLLQRLGEEQDSSKMYVQCDRTTASTIPLEAPIEPGGVLPMGQRLAGWKRWANARGHRSRSKQIEAIASFDRVIYSAADSRLLASNVAEHLFPAWTAAVRETPESSHWQTSEARELTAFAGFIAHPTASRIGVVVEEPRRETAATKQKQDQRIEAAFEARIRAPRHLLPGIPDLWPRLNSVVTTPPQIRSQLRIRLKPAAVRSHLMEDLRFLPELELIIEADEHERSSTLASARFVRGWRVSDLLQPEQAADLRFMARSLIRSATDIDPTIRAFVANSQLDVFGDSRLRTPPQLTLAVPRFACESWPVTATKVGPRLADPADPVVVDAAQRSPNELVVEYAFASLEHHSSLSTRYLGHLIRYSTIEAGRTGGRREELRFDLPDLSISDFATGDAAGRQLYLDWFDGVREFSSRLFQ